MSDTGLPVPRMCNSHAAVVTDDVMMIHGGRDSDGNVVGPTFFMYDMIDFKMGWVCSFAL